MSETTTIDEITYAYVTTYRDRGGSLWSVTDERTGESARFQLDREIDSVEALRAHLEANKHIDHASGLRARLRSVAERRKRERFVPSEAEFADWKRRGWTS